MYENFTTNDLLHQIKNNLEDILKRMPDNGKYDAYTFGWIDQQELMQLLHISDRTALEWRQKGVLGYTRIKGKIYYQVADIQEMMMSRFSKRLNFNGI